MKMNTKRTIAITLTLLMTASAVGTLVSAAVVAPTKSTSLTIYSTDLYPTVGESINIYGRLMNAAGTGYIQGASVQGQAITLTYSTDDGLTWQPLGTAAMSYYGGYSYTTTSSQLPLLDYQGGSDGNSTYLIQASFAGNTQYAPSSVTITIEVYPVAPVISIQTSVAAPVTNQPFTISGKVADYYNGKACPGMWVQLYAYNQWTGDYQSLSAQTNANGVYKFSAIQLLAGYWQIEVYTDGDYNHLSGYNSVYVQIYAAPTQLSIASGTAHPAALKAFTVYGLLTNAVTGARLPYEPQQSEVDPGLTLTYSTDNVNWNTWPTEVYTNGNGQYAFSVTLPAGTYYIQVHFPGDLNYNPSDIQLPGTITVG